MRDHSLSLSAERLVLILSFSGLLTELSLDHKHEQRSHRCDKCGTEKAWAETWCDSCTESRSALCGGGDEGERMATWLCFVWTGGDKAEHFGGPVQWETVKRAGSRCIQENSSVHSKSGGVSSSVCYVRTSGSDTTIQRCGLKRRTDLRCFVMTRRRTAAGSNRIVTEDHSRKWTRRGSRFSDEKVDGLEHGWTRFSNAMDSGAVECEAPLPTCAHFPLMRSKTGIPGKWRTSSEQRSTSSAGID